MRTGVERLRTKLHCRVHGEGAWCAADITVIKLQSMRLVCFCDATGVSLQQQLMCDIYSIIYYIGAASSAFRNRKAGKQERKPRLPIVLSARPFN
jgi:hypothetical protein